MNCLSMLKWQEEGGLEVVEVYQVLPNVARMCSDQGGGSPKHWEVVHTLGAILLGQISLRIRMDGASGRVSTGAARGETAGNGG